MKLIIYESGEMYYIEIDPVNPPEWAWSYIEKALQAAEDASQAD